MLKQPYLSGFPHKAGALASKNPCGPPLGSLEFGNVYLCLRRLNQKTESRCGLRHARLTGVINSFHFLAMPLLIKNWMLLSFTADSLTGDPLLSPPKSQGHAHIAATQPGLLQRAKTLLCLPEYECSAQLCILLLTHSYFSPTI